ncbi:MAG: (cytosine-5)-methyltransferase 1 [Acidobacteriota bacterium]|nr:(cytosine-5)-methyltransferase 1 [Acidobacteriota bacterium]
MLCFRFFVSSKMPEPERRLRFIDLFAGLGGFHLALNALGHECVFASEIDDELCDLYEKNFGLRPTGNLRTIHEDDVPEHDVLCAGFPCQPFSKAGEQLGTKCRLWGDLFSKHVLRLLRRHTPTYLIMENVANLERHNGGRTWKKMRRQLEECGYNIDTRILSPHFFGVPQIRERLFIVGSRVGLGHFSWPEKDNAVPNVDSVLDVNPPDAKALPTQVVRCLEVWQDFLNRSPTGVELPSFPIWTMEFGATYPFTKYDSLHNISLSTLRNYKGTFGQSLQRYHRKDLLSRIPTYARAEENAFPRWKQLFIKQNREFYQRNKSWIKPWLPTIRSFPSSLQKFEWNCKGEVRDLWRYVIQFRASGVRVKRPTTAPSLVAMTTTQIPIIAWERRYMTPLECSRLQSMERLPQLPPSETSVCKALGNAVNVEVVRRLAHELCSAPTMVPEQARAA